MATSFPSSSVVDTNVPLVANGKQGASSKCINACACALNEIMETGKVFVDSRWLIIGEYTKKLSSSGEPGPGDAFLKWILTNRDNPNKCEYVCITPKDRNGNDFKEFPNDPDLKGFDPSDRKFVAVSACHKSHPPILQATDSKWIGFRKALLRNKIKVVFLCEEEIQRAYLSKGKGRK